MPTGIPSGRRLTRPFAKHFCETLASSTDALFEILRQHPEWPDWQTLRRWRDRNPWFAESWRKAREDQGEHLAQKCLDLAAQANPKNAHAIRVKYDIYKWIASRFAPAQYGDKPVQPQTNIQIGFSISAERLNEIRSKLDMTRTTLNANGNTARNLPKLTDNHTDATDDGGESLPLEAHSHTCPP